MTNHYLASTGYQYSIVWGYNDTHRVVTTPLFLEAYLSSKGYQCSIVWGYSDTHIYQYDYTYLHYLIHTRYYYKYQYNE